MSTAPDFEPFARRSDATEPSAREAMRSFRSWLVHDRSFSGGAASSHVSLCRRVERELALSLDESVQTNAGLEGVIDRIREEILTVAPDKTRREGQASLFSAVRRYAEFLTGRLGSGQFAQLDTLGGSKPSGPIVPQDGTTSATEDSIHSSYREMLLEHLFAGAVMRHLWLKGFVRMELLKPQVDDGGYDLVLEANGIVHHVQMKASRRDAETRRQSINVALAEKPSGCVIWLRFDPESLNLGPFLWFGGAPGERLPDLTSFPVAKHTKGNAQGVKTERPNIRRVPMARFEQLARIDEVVAHLFGV